MNFTVSHNSTISVQPESSLYLLTRVKRRNAEAQKKEWTVYNFTAKVNASAQERPDEAA